MHNQYRSYYKPYSANQNPSYSPRQPPVHPFYGQGNEYMNGPGYLDYANSPLPNSNSYLHLNQNSGRNYGIRYPQYQPAQQQTPPSSINPVANVPVNSNSPSNPYKAPISVSSSTPTTTTITNNSTSNNASSLQPSSDEARLPVLRAVVSRSQKRLNEIEQQKKLLEDEERRLKQSLAEKKAEIEKIESRIGTAATGLSPSAASVNSVTSVNLSGATRDPRLKNRILNHPSVGGTVSSSTLTVNNSSFNVDSASLFSSNSPMSSASSTNTTASYVPSNSTLSSLLAVPSSSTTPVITSPSLFTPATSSQPSTSDSTQRLLNRSSAYQPPLFINSSSTTVVQSNPQRMLVPTTVSNSNSTNVSSSSISSSAGLFFPTTIASGNNSMPIQPSVFSALFNKKDGLAKNNNTVSQSNKEKQAKSVQFKSLPLVFDESTEDLMVPRCFSEVRLKLSFKFTQHQLRSITDQSIGRRVLIRICVIKAKKSSQSDRVPRKLQIKVNGRLTSSSKNQQGTIKAPIDITALVSTVYGANQEVELIWPDSEPIKDYGIGLFLVKRLSIEQTLAILLTKDYQRPRSETLKLIKQNYENTGDICSEEIMIPLICPITKQKLEFPCVGSKCGHLNCFDGKSFVNINRARTEWHCPSCKKPIGYNDLRIDELVSQIVGTTGADVTRVKFDPDGNWKPVSESKNDSDCSNVIDDSWSQIDVITLDDSDDERPAASSQHQTQATREVPRRKEDVVIPPSPEVIAQMISERFRNQTSMANQRAMQANAERVDNDEEEEEDEEDEEEEDDEEEDGDEEGETSEAEESDRSQTSRSEGEITDDDDEDPDFELDSSPNHRNKRSKRPRLDDSTLEDEIRLPAKTRDRKKKTNAEIFGSDTDSGSPHSVPRKRRRLCSRSSKGKRS